MEQKRVIFQSLRCANTVQCLNSGNFQGLHLVHIIYLVQIFVTKYGGLVEKGEADIIYSFVHLFIQHLITNK